MTFLTNGLFSPSVLHTVLPFTLAHSKEQDSFVFFYMFYFQLWFPSQVLVIYPGGYTLIAQAPHVQIECITYSREPHANGTVSQRHEDPSSQKYPVAGKKNVPEGCLCQVFFS